MGTSDCLTRVAGPVIVTPQQRGRRGFTMIEAMIIVAAIGLLVAIAIPSYRKVRTQSRIERAEATLQMIASAVRRLTWDTGKWPSGAALASPGSAEVWNLAATSAGLVGATATFTGSGWRGPYMRKIELDPWGKPYFFDPDYPVKGVNRCVVGSFGPNGVGQNVYDSDDIYVICP